MSHPQPGDVPSISPPLPRASLRRLRAWLLDPATVLCGFLIVAFVVRAYGADLVHTSDEGYWMQRTVRFGVALTRADLGSTYRTGHPGVTVMWTGVAGLGLERLAAYQPAWFIHLGLLQRDAGYLAAFTSARHAMILVVACLLAITVGLAWLLAGRGAGLLGGTILLLDPYVVGMTRLLHPDALLALLMAISGLAGLIWWRQGQRRYLVLSALAGGLALLTKAPAVYVVIYFGAAGMMSTWAWRRPRRWFGGLAAWGLLATVTYVMLWPALWVDAPGVMANVAAFVLKEGGQPHNWSSFFWGERIVSDPGPLFYPMALAFRLSPIALCGVLLAPLGGWQQRRHAGIVVALGGFALGFVALMTFSDKKLDRYLLPTIVMLDLLAGIGLWLVFSRLRRVQRGRALLVGAISLQAMTLWSAYPYPLAYYNPLLGGAAAAERTMVIGWGEGIEQVAAYLNAQPNAEDQTASTLYHLALRPLFKGKTVRIVEPVSPDYFIVYVNMAQRQLIPHGIQKLISLRPPEFTAYVHGLAYAQVYRLPAGVPVLSPGVTVDPPTDDGEYSDEGQ